MPTRKYFTKAHTLDKPPKVIKPPKSTDYVVEQSMGGSPRIYAGSYVDRKEGQHQRMLELHRQGLAHTFTSETGRQAVQRTWRTRWRMNKRIGRRVGYAAKRKPYLNHKILRELHNRPTIDNAPFFNMFEWEWKVTDNGQLVTLSERAALTRLGYYAK